MKNTWCSKHHGPRAFWHWKWCTLTSYYFIDEETEDQRGEATSTRSYNYTMTEVKIKPKSPNPCWEVPIQDKVVKMQRSPHVPQTHLLHNQLSRGWQHHHHHRHQESDAASYWPSACNLGLLWAILHSAAWEVFSKCNSYPCLPSPLPISDSLQFLG